MIEYAAGCELRAEGRTLTGPAMRYGDVAPGFRERFEAHAFETRSDPLTLNVQHDGSLRVASTADTLTVADSARTLDVRAELPPDSAALTLARSGALRGLSVGFHSLREHRDANGIRVIERAHLDHIALVDRPAYPAATVEVRGRRNALARMQSYIPRDTPVGCRCSGIDCKFAEFVGDTVRRTLDKAFDAAARDIARELAEAEAAQAAAALPTAPTASTAPTVPAGGAVALGERADDGDVIACWGGFDKPLASVSRGTLRRSGDHGFEIDLPDTPIGHEVLDAIATTGVIIRPHLDAAESEGERVGETMRYTKATVRAFVVSATDAREGWPVPTLDTANRADLRRLL